MREEYTYFTKEQFEGAVHGLGMRVLASTPIQNPWIVRHRFRGKFTMSTLGGEPCEDPATNIVVVGEKVPRGEGVRFEDRGDADAIGFLELSAWRDRRTGAIRDLVRRPNRTVDVVPWFERGGDLFVLARTSYPRPIVACTLATDSIDGAKSPSWMAEPLIVVQGDKPLGQTVEEALAAQARIGSGRILGMHTGSTYYPSPGGTQEEVAPVQVAIEPLFVEENLPRNTAFSTAGRLRAIEARQLLRAAQVGGIPDARLELNAYDLLARNGRDRGPWIGETIDVADVPLDDASKSTMASLLARPSRRVFERDDGKRAGDFLEIRCRAFAEIDSKDDILSEVPLELVLPRTRSTTSMAVAPLLRANGSVWIGIDDDDLPAAQCFSGNSELLVAPAWRLPRDVAVTSKARAWVNERLRAEYGVVVKESFELGGRFLPSAGLSPEAVHPLAVSVAAIEKASRSLVWVELADAARSASFLADGHLRVCVLRAAHALGV
ncbi:hypothetical protein AKJ09_09783 [Labilithrix luteola]|uniref:Uncharacterized protein n=1 Tax=Labilithrix luteola TaxID=1391654 RepID=A0A0K1QCG2_9BACT|nr:hypothetical protein AKJ09_09783 [Labilithrix luteola]